MKVEIVSIQAAIHGRPSIIWTGNVPGVVTTDTAEHVNDLLFRFFNRVDVEDEERLEQLGYRLPSLSVGDLLHWGAKTWRVAGSGFEPITGSDEYVTALALYTLESTARKEATE
jgi:hypothetical protein